MLKQQYAVSSVASTWHTDQRCFRLDLDGRYVCSSVGKDKVINDVNL